MADKMIRIVVTAIGWFGFGIILAEIFNNMSQIQFRFEPVIFAGILSMVYMAFKLVLGRLECRPEEDEKGSIRYHKILKTYEFLMVVLSIFFLILIPFIWFGVIKKLAAGGGV